MRESVSNHIDEVLNIDAKLKIVEEQIDIDLQFEYFNLSKNAKQNIGADNAISRIEELFDGSASDEELKTLLVQLASIDKAPALRAIERFHQQAAGSMKQWAYLAQKESCMLLESSLLDEKQVLISTGLGGKNGMLRYFLALLASNGKALTCSQQKVVLNEFDFVMRKNSALVENIEFKGRFACVTVLIPLKASLKNIIAASIDECNSYGNFLSLNYLLTNVKFLEEDEISQFLRESGADTGSSI
jgi:hypothetical protein